MKHLNTVTIVNAEEARHFMDAVNNDPTAEIVYSIYNPSPKYWTITYSIEL